MNSRVQSYLHVASKAQVTRGGKIKRRGKERERYPSAIDKEERE